mgnify:CR=1 FL=1
MPTPLWSDIFKTFTYAFEKDPLSRKLQSKDIVGAGIISPDSIPSISPDGSYWNGQDNRLIRLRESQDFINALPLRGEEIINLEIATPTFEKDDQVFKGKYYIYKISDRQTLTDRNTVYTMFCISYEALVDLNMKQFLCLR